MDLTVPLALHRAPSPEAREFFQSANFLVLKLTDYCNLKCKYCHQDALVGKPVLMPIETYKNAVRLILQPSRAPVVNVQFHGGEPLLCPDDFFREAVAYARATLERPDRRVAFYIQTNLTRVSAEREAMLRALDIGISFSLDGPPEINDELRGGGDRIEQNWRRMRANGTEAGTICLIQPSNWDRMPEVLRYFEQERIFSVRFNLMVPDGRGKAVDLLTTEKLFGAKKVILDYMLETGGQKVVDTTLLAAMKRFMKPNGSPATAEYHGCESLYCQAGRGLYSVNPDGRFYACDRIAEAPSWAMGNVNDAFGADQDGKARTMRHRFHHKDDWWARCEPCPAKKICEFSCSAYYVDAVDSRDIECEYTQRMWDYFLERHDDIRAFVLNQGELIQIDGRRPLEEQPSETWFVRDLAVDAAYNAISSFETLAANRRFQVLERRGQYFIYVLARDRIFEVDEMVAEIAAFNGMLSPDLIERALKGKYPKGRLRTVLRDVARAIPEVLSRAEGAQEAMVEHVRGHALAAR